MPGARGGGHKKSRKLNENSWRARWGAAYRRQRIVTVDDARRRARAVQARLGVESALFARERVVAEQEAAVLAARSELARASRQMALYGRSVPPPRPPER